MVKSCASCACEFEAKRSTAVYCSTKCRVRAYEQRKRGENVVPIRSAPAAPTDLQSLADVPSSEDVPAGLVAGLRAEYKPADLATPIGLIALRLASDVDRMIPGAPGYAAVVKQMREAVDDLRSQAKPKAVTPLALIRERRAADRAASGG